MSIYTPTYLYIKQHSITGKLYFGKTIKDPEKYLGSGVHWKSHIKKHGKEHVVNLWYCLFLDQESITEFALNFSKQQNIVESSEWLNLIEENGTNGDIGGAGSINYGRRASEETKNKMRCSAAKSHSNEHNINVSNALKGKKKSDIHKSNLSKATSDFWNASTTEHKERMKNFARIKSKLSKWVTDGENESFTREHEYLVSKGWKYGRNTQQDQSMRYLEIIQEKFDLDYFTSFISKQLELDVPMNTMSSMVDISPYIIKRFITLQNLPKPSRSKS